ncbi:MAG: hypothetical protein ACKN9P_09270, partial [Phenylobacterium sp.]
MSLEAAHILAPVTTGLPPAGSPSPAGEASGGGDFAALLENLAGILRAARNPGDAQAQVQGEAGKSRLTPAAAPGGAGPGALALDAGAALVVELPALPGLPATPLPSRLALGLAVSLERPAADAPEREADAIDVAATLPEGTGTPDPAPGLLLAGLAIPAPRAAPAPVAAQAASPVAGKAGQTSFPLESPAAPVPPMGAAGLVSSAPTPALDVSPPLTSGPAPEPVRPVDGALQPGPAFVEMELGPEAGVTAAAASPRPDAARAPGPTASAFAQTNGVVAVTGRRAPSETPEATAPAARVQPGSAAAAPAGQARVPGAVALAQPEGPVEAAAPTDTPEPGILATLAGRPESRPIEGRRKEAPAGRIDPASLKPASGPAAAAAAPPEAMAVTDPVTPCAPQARSADTPAPAAVEDREDLFASADPAEP